MDKHGESGVEWQKDAPARTRSPVRAGFWLVMDFLMWVFGHFLKWISVGTELWAWIREAVTFLPGAIGMTIRVRFYNSYLKRKSSTMAIMAGAYIEHPQYAEFGDHVTLGRNAWVAADGGIRVGDFTGIGPGVTIHTANHKYSDRSTPFLKQGHELKPVIIEEDVWVAAGVIILPGTHIGRGAVIVAGSIVSGNVEPFAVMAGCPARKIGVRGNGQP